MGAEEQVENDQEEKEGTAVIHRCRGNAGIGVGVSSNGTAYVVLHCQSRTWRSNGE